MVNENKEKQSHLITHDPATDAVYIYKSPNTDRSKVYKTVEVPNFQNVYCDLDKARNIIGIELLHPDSITVREVIKLLEGN